MTSKKEPKMPKFAKAPVAILVNSPHSSEKVVNEARVLSTGDDFVVLLKRSLDIERKLLPAYINAAVRKNDGTMHSNSLSLEIMLFIAGTMNIGNAVDKVAASGKEFVIFASSRKLAESLISRFKLSRVSEYDLEINTLESGRIATTPIRDGK